MKEMQNWFKENLTEVRVEEVWLPSSPDCKPFKYFVCGVSELRVKAKSRNKSKDLIQKLKEVMGSLTRDTLAKGPGSRLSPQLMVVLLNILIVYVSLLFIFLLQ
jgi:hypothetical protein